MTQSNHKTKRQTTLYDAVAGTSLHYYLFGNFANQLLSGRVSSTGFIPPNPRISAYRDTPTSSTVAVPPEEVLFRRKGAPTRYEEDDLYWADRKLNDNQKLPESDLLKAIHAYSSDFYGRAVKGRGKVDFESLDETALLAVGILMEEMARDALGETGDLAFVEGENSGVNGAEEVALLEETTSGGEENLSPSVKASGGASEAATSDRGSSGGDKRRRKRRKTRRDDTSDG